VREEHKHRESTAEEWKHTCEFMAWRHFFANKELLTYTTTLGHFVPSEATPYLTYTRSPGVKTPLLIF
jgi:hypothetical protein